MPVPSATAQSAANIQPPPLSEALAAIKGEPCEDLIAMMLGLLHGLKQHSQPLAGQPLGALAQLEWAAVQERGKRLEELTALGDEVVTRDWVGPDLLPQLDALARLMSSSAHAALAQEDGAMALFTYLARTLYDVIGKTVRERGLFVLESVVPYNTPFDASVHQAVGTTAMPGYVGRVIEVQRVGRRHAQSGAVLSPAQVIVGSGEQS